MAKMNTAQVSYVRKARAARKLGKKGISLITLHPRTHEVKTRERIYSCWCLSRDFVANPARDRCPQHGNTVNAARGRKGHFA